MPIYEGIFVRSFLCCGGLLMWNDESYVDIFFAKEVAEWIYGFMVEGNSGTKRDMCVYR